MAGLPIGWADSLVRAVDDLQAGRTPNTLTAIEIAIQPEYRGQGVSYRMLRAARALAEEKGFQAVIVAVRPSLKSRYPITPMEQYVRWQRDDGAPFDPWLRAHWRVGAEILNVAHPSMVIEGSVDDWEQWTGMAFPQSGDYVVPDALAPIQIDRTMHVGRYIEPNVWVHHPITTQWLHRRKIILAVASFDCGEELECVAALGIPDSSRTRSLPHDSPTFDRLFTHVARLDACRRLYRRHADRCAGCR